MHNRLVIFDFDGTLVDTESIICHCLEVAVAGTPLARPAAAFKPLMGRDLPLVYAVLIAGTPTLELTEAEFVHRFLEEDDRLAQAPVHAFPGIATLLTSLEAPLAVASTKPTATVLDYARRAGIAHHFRHLQGTDGFAPKPDPGILHRVWRQVPAPPRSTFFVGDSTSDIRAGRSAGCRTIGVTWGAATRSQLSTTGADHIVDTVDELHALLCDE